MVNQTPNELYSQIYRCEDCREIKSPIGVHYFVNGRGQRTTKDYLPITVPVACFGDVVSVKSGLSQQILMAPTEPIA